MDPLTQRLLERTRARREDLAKKMAENKMESQKRKTPLRPSSTINTMENKKQEAPVEKPALESTDTDSPKTSMKKRFNVLATQRAQWDHAQGEGKDLESSPVLPKLQTRQAAKGTEEPAPSQPVPPTRKSRFAALAANINSWEDDTNHAKHEFKQEEKPVKKWKRPAPAEPEEESRPTPAKREVSQTRGNNQILPRSPIKKSLQNTKTTDNQDSAQVNQTKSTMSRAARFQLGSSRLGDNGFQTATSREVVLPQSSKCSVVEKPATRTEPKAATRTPTAPQPSLRSKNVEEKLPSPKKRPSQEHDTGISSKKQATSSTVAQVKKSQPAKEDARSKVLSPNRVEPKVGAMAKSIQERLKAHQNNWQSNEISKKIQADRMKDLAVLKNRWAKSGGEVKIEEMEEDHEDEEEKEDIADSEEEESMEDSSEDGEPYMETEIDAATTEQSNNVQTDGPSVTDITEEKDDDDVEEEEEADDADDEDESEVNLTDVLGDIDELIVEAEKAMKDEQEKVQPVPEVEPVQQQIKVETTCERPPSVPQRSRHSVQTPKPAAPVAVERRVAPQAVNPQPAKRIVREEQVKEEKMRNRGTSRSKQSSNAEKIRLLQEEVSRQQIIINQTSQALSLIACNESLRNTMEEIEAEKMMVISNQKRQACLSEIQFLKNSPASDAVFTEDGEEVVASKGHVLIKDIRLPFKTEYIMDLQSNKEMPSHYYFVITRCGALTSSTNLMNTRENLTGDCLKFSTEITINDLDGDFGVELLVYQLRSSVTKVEGMAERAQIQHSVPAKHSRFGSLTPKKLLANKHSSKTQSSKLSTHGQGGSRPVRASTFALVGSGRLSLASCGTTKFMLSRVPLTSPLEGSIHLCMSCQKNSSIVLKGFLTMFDEISGFGSWHRRWCVLAEGYITFWKYPDDERKKPPIGSIDLRECISKEVAQISRIVCARPNTFELVTSRPATRYEKDTLISTCNNSMLTTKHMISADVKEERVEWIDALNRTLEDLRKWNRDAATPRE